MWRRDSQAGQPRFVLMIIVIQALTATARLRRATRWSCVTRYLLGCALSLGVAKTITTSNEHGSSKPKKTKKEEVHTTLTVPTAGKAAAVQ